VTDSHRTSSIPRARRSGIDATTSGTRHPRLGEFTRPIARNRQLVKGRGKRTLIGLGALLVALALAAALFVLPVKAWLRQRDDIAAQQHELDVLRQANTDLANEVARLQTPEGAKEAARSEIGVVTPGEVRLSVLPAPAAPLTLPGGWPYDTISQVLSVRAHPDTAAPSSGAATTAP
jgi:cell division protein FtsB